MGSGIIWWEASVIYCIDKYGIYNDWSNTLVYIKLGYAMAILLKIVRLKLLIPRKKIIKFNMDI